MALPRFEARISDISDRARKGWLLSYGDMITLIITFFIMMLNLRAGEISRVHAWVNSRLDETATEIQNVINVLKIQNIQISRDSKGVRITLDDPRLFDTGSAGPKNALIYQLKSMGAAIASLDIVDLKDSQWAPWLKEFQRNGLAWNFEIRVEGHTDNVPLIPGGKYRDNWDLSAARAQTVMRLLQETTKLPEANFAVAGFGMYHPIATNSSREGRDKNRRVEIFIDASLVKRQ
jgi:chemotaxis protein MotB